MTDNSLRDRFDRLVEDEPLVRLSLDPVVSEGRRLRRRHRATLVVGAAGMAVVAATAVAVPLALSQHQRPADTLGVTPFALTGSQPWAAAAASGDDLSPAQQRMADAIRAASPDGWTFDFAADRWEGLSLEGNADDGTGAGRLMIGLSTGTQLLHPCADSEFKAGVECTERTLPDGSVLSVRAVVDYHGMQYDDVALTHPDGSGVFAESGNFTISWPLPGVITAREKKHLQHISRAAPTYTPEQLGRLALAVDRATS
jgi:hypothetical protein